MKNKAFAALLPAALLLSACTTVEPAYKDIGTRAAPCVEGGPDTVAQNFTICASRSRRRVCRTANCWRATALT